MGGCGGGEAEKGDEVELHFVCLCEKVVLGESGWVVVYEVVSVVRGWL